jgi:tellurite resistance protein TehA-like permease
MTWHERRHEKQDILGLASFGFFLMLVGIIWIVTPNLLEEVRKFLEDFKLKEVFPNVFLPAPASSHPVVYMAIARFCFVFGLFQIFILALRVVFREAVNKIAGTFSGMIFWLGAGFVANMLSTETIKWFAFVGWIIMLIGLSLVIRSLVVLLFEFTLRKD